MSLIDQAFKLFKDEKIKGEKVNEERLDIELPLIFLADNDYIKVSLVELDGELFFADYGKTIGELEKEFEKIENSPIVIDRLANLEVMLDGNSLLKTTSLETLFEDYNKFIYAIIFIQTLLY